MVEGAEDELGRGKMSLGRRIDLLERDRAQQSRAITELINKVQKGFTPEQLDQIRTAFREELADAGLRLDDATQQDEAREDFRFLRRLRQSWDRAAGKVGNAALLGVIGVCATIIGLGFWAWISSGGKPH
jgi:uncharacterized coiled-coil protein SlyX